MKPPPLLLLLLVAGFVSCIPQGRHEGGDAEDSLVPQSGVGSSGSSKNLSEDADQQSVKPLPREVRADDDTQARNDLREPNLVQTQGEGNINLRVFSYREILPRSNRTRSSRGHGQRVSSSREPKSYGADGNNFQQNDKGNSAKKEGMKKNDDGDDDDDKDNKSDDDEDDESNDEVDKEEKGGEQLRRPPKSRKKKPKKGWNGRRTPRFREGHDDIKRGYGEYNNSDSDDETSPLLERQMKSREKRQPGRREGNDSDSSNSDNANEETALLRSSRHKRKNITERYKDDTRNRGSRWTTDKQILPKTKHYRYQKLRQRDRRGSDSDDRGYDNDGYYGDDEGQEINKRIFFFSSKNKPKKRKTAKSGLRKKFSRFRSWMKKRIHNHLPYQRFRDSEGYDDDDGYYEDTEGHDIVERGMRSIINWFKKKTANSSAPRDSDKADDGGRDNNGYDGGDEMYGNDDGYNDETMLLPAKKRRRPRAFFRNKRGDLDQLERVLRNFALTSSRLEEEVTPTTSPPPLLKNKIEKDVNGGNEDEDDKVSKYEEGDSQDEGIGRDYYNDG